MRWYVVKVNQNKIYEITVKLIGIKLCRNQKFIVFLKEKVTQTNTKLPKRLNTVKKSYAEEH